MLADEDAALLDEGLCALHFESLIVPGAGEDDLHGSRGANGLCAEEEGGIAGLDLCVGHCTDIADDCLLCGDLVVCDHLIKLEACCNACDVAALVNCCECIVEVINTVGKCGVTGAGGELNFGEFLGSLKNIGLVTVAVGENYIAACLGKLSSCVVSSLALFDVGLDLVLNAGSLAGSLECVDEVCVVGGVLVVQADEADLDLCGIAALIVILVVIIAAACAQCKHHDECEDNCSKLFHLQFSSNKKFIYYQTPLREV